MQIFTKPSLKDPSLGDDAFELKCNVCDDVAAMACKESSTDEHTTHLNNFWTAKLVTLTQLQCCKTVSSYICSAA